MADSPSSMTSNDMRIESGAQKCRMTFCLLPGTLSMEFSTRFQIINRPPLSSDASAMNANLAVLALHFGWLALSFTLLTVPSGASTFN